MRKKVACIMLCLFVLVATFAACGGGGNQGGGGGEERPSFVIGLSQEGLDHSYMITQRDEIIAAAAAYTDADVRVISTDGQNSVATQVMGIEDMLAQGINLLMIQAGEGEGLRSALDRAEELGVPYIFVGKHVHGTNADALIGNDNYEIGMLAGQWTVEYLIERNGSPSGNVAIIAGIPGDQSAEDRVKGFLNVVEAYPDINIIANIYAYYRRPQAFSVMQDILQANPVGTIDVLYGTNGETSIGAAQAIADAGRTGEFAVLSIDGDVASIEEIKAGRITVAWTFETGGSLGFEVAMRILRGEEVPLEFIIATKQIDASNAETATPAF